MCLSGINYRGYTWMNGSSSIRTLYNRTSYDDGQPDFVPPVSGGGGTGWSATALDQAHGLGPGPGAVPEHPAHGRGDGPGARLAHTAHGHAQVLGLDDHEH